MLTFGPETSDERCTLPRPRRRQSPPEVGGAAGGGAAEALGEAAAWPEALRAALAAAAVEVAASRKAPRRGLGCKRGSSNISLLARNPAPCAPEAARCSPAAS